MRSQFLLAGLPLVLMGSGVLPAEEGPSSSKGSSGSAADAVVSDEAGRLISLAGSLSPLRERFNADKDKHRFIAILSPT